MDVIFSIAAGIVVPRCAGHGGGRLRRRHDGRPDRHGDDQASELLLPGQNADFR
jgi:hypothetical protein